MRGKWAAALAALLAVAAFLGLRGYYDSAPWASTISTVDTQTQQTDNVQTQTTSETYVEQAGESSETTPAPGGRRSNATLTLYIEDDAGPLDGLVFILPAAPEDDSLPDRLEPVAVVRGRLEAPGHVEKLLEKWNADKYPKVGITVVIVNGTDIATAPALVDLKAYKRAKERGEKYEVKVKVRGKAKRDRGDKGTHFAACPRAVMVKEDEYQTDFIQTPIFRVRNLAEVYGHFFIGFVGMNFTFGLAVQEDIGDLTGVSFKIEGISHMLDAKHSGSYITGIPPSGGRMIYIWTKGRYEVYRLEYYATYVSRCFTIDQDWLYRVYPTAVQTNESTMYGITTFEIVIGEADMTDTDFQIPGTELVPYRSYVGTGLAYYHTVYDLDVRDFAEGIYH